MNVLLFTAPGYVEHEHEMVEAMFGLGLRRLHLRKPDWSEAQVDDWLEALDPAWLHRIILHDHHSLASYYYQVGGVHLNSRNPELLPDLRQKQQAGQITVSCSCHSLAELAEKKQSCDYVTLSPIFDSISKAGYQAAFSAAELEAAAASGLIDRKVYALGGITTDEIEQIRKWNFGGVGLLGSIWQQPNPVSAILSYL